MSTGELDASSLVRAIVDEARKKVGSGPLFAERLEQLGVGPESGRYSQSAVSNWINGRTMPPADVLLAAAQIAGLSIDERLLGSSASTSPPAWEEAIASLQEQIDTLQAQMIEVFGNLGLPMSQPETRPDVGVRRSAAG